MKIVLNTLQRQDGIRPTSMRRQVAAVKPGQYAAFTERTRISFPSSSPSFSPFRPFPFPSPPPPGPTCPPPPSSYSSAPRKSARISIRGQIVCGYPHFLADRDRIRISI